MNKPTLSKQALKCLKHLREMDDQHGGFHDLSDFETFMVGSLEKKDLIQPSRGKYRITGRGRKAINNHKLYLSSYDRLRKRNNRALSEGDAAHIRQKLEVIKALIAEVESLLDDEDAQDRAS